MTFVSHSFPGGSRTGELIAMDSGRLNHFGRRTSVFFRDFGFSPLLKILVPPPSTNLSADTSAEVAHMPTITAGALTQIKQAFRRDQVVA